MTELEKMRSGLWFNAGDRELVAMRQKAKALCKQMNQQGPVPVKAHQQLARQLFGQVSRCYIEPDFYCDYGVHIDLGENFYANHHCVMLDAAPIRIGRDVLLGPGVQIYTVTHPLEAELRKTGIEQALPVTIGDSVWIGGGSIILPGVTIGHGAVIAAGTVVTKDVESYSLVAGNPARWVRALDQNLGA
ncbi:sugar O-acetyltransferase [Rheinheimera sp.]|uniref:sugar O-acetyltransferase n=1 Tax=Rheinheimera sp. TaxID=1869214 RepID=UPI003AF5CB29